VSWRIDATIAAFHIPLRPLAMAAGIIVVIGVGVVVREQRGDDARTLRGGVTAIRLGVPEPSADGGVVLRWGRVADATRYRVEVFTGTGTTVAEATVSDTTFVVQPIALASTTEPLQWMVTALRADGGEQRSATGRIVR
jgi:hypothetical protein